MIIPDDSLIASSVLLEDTRKVIALCHTSSEQLLRRIDQTRVLIEDTLELLRSLPATD